MIKLTSKTAFTLILSLSLCLISCKKKKESQIPKQQIGHSGIPSMLLRPKENNVDTNHYNKIITFFETPVYRHPSEDSEVLYTANCYEEFVKLDFYIGYDGEVCQSCHAFWYAIMFRSDTAYISNESNPGSYIKSDSTKLLIFKHLYGQCELDPSQYCYLKSRILNASNKNEVFTGYYDLDRSRYINDTIYLIKQYSRAYLYSITQDSIILDYKCYSIEPSKLFPKVYMLYQGRGSNAKYIIGYNYSTQEIDTIYKNFNKELNAYYDEIEALGWTEIRCQIMDSIEVLKFNLYKQDLENYKNDTVYKFEVDEKGSVFKLTRS